MAKYNFLPLDQVLPLRHASCYSLFVDFPNYESNSTSVSIVRRLFMTGIYIYSLWHFECQSRREKTCNKIVVTPKHSANPLLHFIFFSSRLILSMLSDFHHASIQSNIKMNLGPIMFIHSERFRRCVPQFHVQKNLLIKNLNIECDMLN